MASEPNRSVVDAISGRRCLLVASTGGHLMQLNQLAAMYAPDASSVWLTFESAQSLSLLHGKNRHFVDYIKPRDVAGVLRATSFARALLKRERFDTVVSTGAGLALAVLPFSRRYAERSLYIESVSRFEGPSLSGRALAKFGHIETYTQHQRWAGERWHLTDSVLADYQRTDREPVPAPRIFVTLGTIRGYAFHQLVDRMLESGLCGEQTVWQLGETVRTDLPGTVHRYMNAATFREEALSADLVVTHAGVGTILQLLDWGISPVVVARRSERNEHVDDHQLQIANYLKAEALAQVLEPAEIGQESLINATAYATSTVESGVCNGGA